MGPAVEIDLGHQFRFDPDRAARAAFFGRHGAERRLSCVSGLRFAVEIARDLHGVKPVPVRPAYFSSPWS